MENIEENERARASFLERIVSLFRGEVFSFFCAVIVVASTWFMCGTLAERSGLITHPAWWMFYGFVVGKLCYFLGNAVQYYLARKEG